MTETELERRFTYHPPVGDQPSRYSAIRREAKGFAELIVAYCPPGTDERKNALDSVDQAVMWANASIARHE